MFAGVGKNFLDELKNLITRKGIFSDEETKESYICQHFMNEYPDMKITSFDELKGVLENITSSQNVKEQSDMENLQYQVEATEFIIENMCTKDVIKTKEEFKALIDLLSDKFKNVKESLCFVNFHLVPVILIKCVNLIDVKVLKEKGNDICKIVHDACQKLTSQWNFPQNGNKCEYILKKHVNYKLSIVHMLGTNKDSQGFYNEMLDIMYTWIVAEKLNDKNRIEELITQGKFLYYYNADWDYTVRLFDVAHLKYLWEFCGMDSKKLCSMFVRCNVAEDVCCWGVTYVDSVYESMVNNLLEKEEVKINRRLFEILASKPIIGIKQEIIYFAKFYFIQVEDDANGKVDKLRHIEKQLKQIEDYKNIDIGRFKNFCDENKEAIIKCKTDIEKSDLMKKIINYINNYQNNLQVEQNHVPSMESINYNVIHDLFSIINLTMSHSQTDLVPSMESDSRYNNRISKE